MNRRVLLELREIIKREEKLLSGYREEAKGIKGGQLVIRRKGDRLVFSEKAKGVETGITTDSRRVRNLARKRYLRGEIRYADKICDILKDALHKIEGVPYARASSNMKEISGYRYSASVTRWLDDAAGAVAIAAMVSSFIILFSLLSQKGRPGDSPLFYFNSMMTLL